MVSRDLNEPADQALHGGTRAGPSARGTPAPGAGRAGLRDHLGPCIGGELGGVYRREPRGHCSHCGTYIQARDGNLGPEVRGLFGPSAKQGDALPKGFFLCSFDDFVLR
jgi:hypothetical protein